MADSLDTLVELERRYDGPIPALFRQDARFGSVQRRLLLEAQGQIALFAALIQSQIEAIRCARHDGVIPGRLFADLQLYRRQEFWWRREKHRLEQLLTLLADDVP